MGIVSAEGYLKEVIKQEHKGESGQPFIGMRVETPERVFEKTKCLDFG